MGRKTNYNYEKRQKEIARKAKQDEKRKRKQQTDKEVTDEEE